MMRFAEDEDETDEALLAWLRGRDEQELARILASRPDALERPWPRGMDELARRLSQLPSVWLALRQVSTPGLELIGALGVCTALADSETVSVARLATQLGSTEAEVDPVLDSLSEPALAWRDQDGYARLAGVLLREFSYEEYDLGPPLRGSVQRATAEQLKALCSTLGLPASGRKQQIVETVVEFFHHPEKVRELVEQAPYEARELLLDGAWHGPYIGRYLNHLFHAGAPRPRSGEEESIAWAVRHGLIWPKRDGGGQLPLEVGIALRGPGYRLPFTPQPPELRTATVNPDSVDSECSTAALRIVDRMHSVLTSASAEPIPLLKSGGVGVRAVRSLAKKLAAAASEIRLVVELACAAGLLSVAEPPEPEPAPSRGRGKRSKSKRPEPAPAPEGLVPTAEFERWQAEGSAGRLRILLETWWNLERSPLADDKAVRAVLGNEPSAAFTDIRHRTVGLLTELEEGQGVTAGTAELIGWQVPLLTPDLIEPLAEGTLAEATLLGVSASGAPGELARSLTAGTGSQDDPTLVKATDSLVAAARTSALFGSDLTAIVTGTADAELAGLLDRVADREAQGSASTWRFSPASVRRAFDNGASADGLLDELGGIAQGELPQPLRYLINDVARRHGEIGVIDVRCVIVGEDPTLLTEIAAHRKLAELGINQLAPTVLAARAQASETLDALRKAGYTPVPRETDGSIAVTRERSAPPATQMRESGTIAVFDGEQFRLADADELYSAPEPDPAEHAARLVREPEGSGQRVTRGDLADHLRGMGTEYDTPRWSNLVWRLESGMAVQVRYHESEESTVTLRISRPELHGDAINVWSSEDDDYRTLELSRITPA